MSIRNALAHETLRDLAIHVNVAVAKLDKASYHMPSGDERSEVLRLASAASDLRAEITELLDAP